MLGQVAGGVGGARRNGRWRRHDRAPWGRHRSYRSRSHHRHKEPRRKVNIRYAGRSNRRSRRFLGHSNQTIRSSKPPGSSKLVAVSWLVPLQCKETKTKAKTWGRELYNTPRDVQTQRGRFFFATGMFFGNALHGIRGMFFLSDQAAQLRRSAPEIAAKVESAEFAVYVISSFPPSAHGRCAANSRSLFCAMGKLCDNDDAGTRTARLRQRRVRRRPRAARTKPKCACRAPATKCGWLARAVKGVRIAKQTRRNWKCGGSTLKPRTGMDLHKRLFWRRAILALPTVFWVHGNRKYPDKRRRRDGSVSAVDGRRFRRSTDSIRDLFLPATPIHGLREDAREKAARTNADGYYLASLVNQMIRSCRSI